MRGVLTGFAAVGVAWSSPVLKAEDPSANGKLVPAEIASVGVDFLTGTPITLLREQDGGRFIPISIGIAEAQAIARALAGMEMPRPMTHDLMRSLLEAADFTIDRIVVHDLQNGTYYATIHGKRTESDEMLEVDSRPSDAMALALRTGSPIWVAEGLLEEIPQFDFAPGDADQQVMQVLGMTVVRAGAAELAEAGLDRGTDALRVLGVAGPVADLVEAGDLILEADGDALAAPLDLLNLLRGKAAEDNIQLKIRRGDEDLEVELPVLPQRLDRPAPRGPAITV